MSEQVEVSPTPSKEWTTEERVAFAAKLAEELQVLAYKGLVPRETILDISERIYFILTMSPGFLEANRKAIVEGQAGFRPNNPKDISIYI